MNKKITQLYFAYVITQFGSYLMMIPAGKVLAKYVALDTAWAVLLIVKSAGFALLPRLYARLSYRHGSARVIAVTQILACAMTIVTLMGFFTNLFGVIVLGIFLESCFSLAFLVLFPAILNQVGDEVSEVKHFLANMVMVEFLAFVFARAAGGVLNQHVTFPWFVAADAATFALASVLWLLYGNKITVHETAPKQGFTSREYWACFLKPYNLIQSLIKIYYGMINPFLPALIITYHHGSDATLGIFYIVAGGGMIVGSQIAKRVTCSRAYFLGLTLGEFLLLAVSYVMPQLWSVLVVMFVSMVMGAMADVFVQTLFMAQNDKERSAEASAVYSTTYRMSMFVGFVLYFAIAKYVSLVFVSCLTLAAMLVAFAVFFVRERQMRRA